MSPNEDGPSWSETSTRVKVIIICFIVVICVVNLVFVGCCGGVCKTVVSICTTIRDVVSCFKAILSIGTSSPTTTRAATPTTRVTTASMSFSSARASTSNVGMNPGVLASLPTFIYSTTDHKDNKLECAVCLAEFQDGDKGRFLPRCLHSFHAECVDVWFNSHSSCPLCRSVIEAEVIDSLV